MAAVPIIDPTYYQERSNRGFALAGQIFLDLPTTVNPLYTPDSVFTRVFELEQATEMWIPYKEYLRLYGESI